MVSLEILGVVILTIIVTVVVAIALFGYFLNKNGADSLVYQQAENVLPRLSIEFKKVSPNWSDQALVDNAFRDLKSLGFLRDAEYQAKLTTDKLTYSVWVHPSQHMVALVCQSTTQSSGTEELLSYHKDLCVFFDDGSTLTVTDNASIDTMPRKAEHRAVILKEETNTKEARESESFFDLFYRLEKELSSLRGLKIKEIALPVIEDIKYMFDDCSSWVWEEEQLRSPKMQQVFANSGVSVDDEVIKFFIETGHNNKIRLLREKIMAQYTLVSGLTITQWEQVKHYLVVINEKMNMDDLVECLFDLELEDYYEDKRDSFNERFNNPPTDPLVTFTEMLSFINASQEVDELIALDQPIRSKIYKPANI